MLSMIVKVAIQMVMRYLLQHLSFDDVLRYIRDAEDRYDNAMKKKGHVYRAIRNSEGEGTPQSTINAALELGVYYWKRFTT